MKPWWGAQKPSGLRREKINKNKKDPSFAPRSGHLLKKIDEAMVPRVLSDLNFRKDQTYLYMIRVKF